MGLKKLGCGMTVLLAGITWLSLSSAARFQVQSKVVQLQSGFEQISGIEADFSLDFLHRTPIASTVGTERAQPLMTQIYLPLPAAASQDDYWSCGPNSAARVLKFYGHDVTYGELRSQIDQALTLPESVHLPVVNNIEDVKRVLTDWSSGKAPQQTQAINVRTGVTPTALQALLQQREGSEVKVARESNLTHLKYVLSEGKPVITLLQVGMLDLGALGQWPEMHWVAVQGFDESQGVIFYTETNGTEKTLADEQFLQMWNWQSTQPLVQEAFFQNGVNPRTMVWIDRTIG